MSASGGAEGARAGWRRAQWLVVPLLVLGAAEALVRLTVDRVPRWYGAALELVARERVDVLFIGSSRVEAAVSPPDFEEAVLARTGRRVRALNLGRGDTTEAEHFLGLRNLLEAHPENLRGVDVLIEAPGGVPFPTSWTRTPWAHATQPFLLVDLLRPADLPAMWRDSGLERETRMQLAARVLLRPIALFHRRERARETALVLLPALARGQGRALLYQAPLGADLRGPGYSVRRDPETVRAARELAVSMGAALARTEDPRRGWPETVLASIVALVRDHGGRLLPFEPPLSEVFAAGYRSPLRQQDRQIFDEQARAWGASVLRPDFRYDDSDLPDLWHLRGERAAEFSQKLAEAWLAARP